MDVQHTHNFPMCAHASKNHLCSAHSLKVDSAFSTEENRSQNLAKIDLNKKKKLRNKAFALTVGCLRVQRRRNYRNFIL